MTTTYRNRGEGLLYNGSLAEARGLAVLAMDDCECPECAQLDPWAPARRVDVLLEGGIRLEHARSASFVRVAPAEYAPGVAGEFDEAAPVVEPTRAT